MAQNCERCRMLEEHMYWNEFDSHRHQFFKILLGDFRSQVRIPTKFSTYLKGGLPNKILLRGPSGKKWPVEVTRRHDDFFFRNGWELFVLDHGLEETDFLVFRFNGSSTFDVSIFDASCCERESSYFVGERREPYLHNDRVTQEKVKEKSVEVIFLDEDEEESLQQGKKMDYKDKAEPSGKHVQFHALPGDNKKKKEILDGFPDDEFETCHPFKKNLNTRKEFQMQYDNKMKMKILDGFPDDDFETFHPFKKNQKIGKGFQSNKSIQVDQKPNEESDVASRGVTGKSSYTPYLTNIRMLTEKEKQRAYQLAARHSSFVPSLLITMQSSHVNKNFILGISRKWAEVHIPSKSQEIQLRVPRAKKKWVVKSRYKQGITVIHRGWVNFVEDNNLEEQDVCIFELAQGGRVSPDPIIFDVSIYRAADY